MALIIHEHHPNGYPVWTIYVGGVATLCDRELTMVLMACIEAGLEWRIQ